MYQYFLKDYKTGEEWERRLLELRKRGENDLNSNLTELTAAEAVDRGFVNHNDWLAHVLRYQHILNFMGAEDRLLDVGCGKMQLAYYAYRNRQPPIAEYWGIDLRATETWLVDIGWKVPVTLIRADFATDAEYLEKIASFGNFDIIVYTEAFEHIGTKEFQEESIYNCFEWLRPGGSMFFSTPNANVSDSTAANHQNPDGTSREWDYADKIALVKEAGFRVHKSYGTFGGVRRLPPEAMQDRTLQVAREYLSTSMFTNFAFLAYPEHANNAMIHCIKPAAKT